MNNRYIITRTCLQEGSMRLLKYNEGHFPQSGPAQFVNDQGREFAVHIDRERMRVSNLNAFYHDHNLGVNDVMIITPIAAGRYQVETIVKPHAITPPAPRTQAPKAPEAQRVVISSTPHVREVRMQRPAEVLVTQPVPAQPAPMPSAPAQPVPSNVSRQDIPRLEPDAHREATREVAALFNNERHQTREAASVRPAASNTTLSNTPPSSTEEHVAEFAHATGYRLSHPASGLMRLSADLGPQHSYSVLLAADPLAMTQPLWEDSHDESKLLITNEAEQHPGQARLTREALSALTEHARLTPISPIDLRGYFRAGNLDLESAASVAELVSAHLAQRGAFSYVLLTIAKQPANSIINVQRLAQSLGSGVNTAELNTILDTLSRPPFLALTPLQGGQYLLRVGVGEILGDLADYAQGIRRRVQPVAEQVAQR